MKSKNETLILLLPKAKQKFEEFFRGFALKKGYIKIYMLLLPKAKL